MRKVEKVSADFFVGSVAGGLFAGGLFLTLGVILGSASSPTDSTSPAIVFVAAGLLLSIYAEVVFLVLLYRSWGCIQDGSPRTTPGKAVGFLLIPVFNWFWIFQALPGFADDYNSYLVRSNVPASRLKKGPFQALAVLSVLSILPILGVIAGLMAVLMECIVAGTLCAAINALAGSAPMVIEHREY